MRKRMRFRRPSNATVVACLALFVALGSGAYAAGGLPDKQSREVKNFANKYSKRYSMKFAKRFSKKFAKRGPVGPQGLQGPQGPPGPSNVTPMSFTNDGSCSPALPLPSGVSSSRPSLGICVLSFSNPVVNCTAYATVHWRPTGLILLLEHERSAQIFTSSKEPNLMAVDTYEDGAKANLPFDLVLIC
jgi:hypothetical protein